MPGVRQRSCRPDRQFSQAGGATTLTELLRRLRRDQASTVLYPGHTHPKHWRVALDAPHQGNDRAIGRQSRGGTSTTICTGMNVGISSCTDEPCRACGGTRTEKGDDKTQAGLATSPLGFADDPRRSAFLPYCRLIRGQRCATTFEWYNAL